MVSDVLFLVYFSCTESARLFYFYFFFLFRGAIEAELISVRNAFESEKSARETVSLLSVQFSLQLLFAPLGVQISIISTIPSILV